MGWWRWSAVMLLALNVPGRAVAAPPGEVDPPPATIVIDANTGQVLREHDADSSRPQGSLNQLMLLLLSLEQSTLGALPLDVPVTVSPAAVSATAGGMRVPLRAARAYLLSDLLKAVTIAAANDAAVGVAEAIAGSVPACIDLMNARAQRLGMTATRYTSIGGVGAAKDAAPDTTTARDLARLAQVLVRQRPVLDWASLSGVPFDGGSVLLRNTNQLLGALAGADGLQVSATRAARGGGSYSIAATAQRDNLRLIAVVLDATDTSTRYGSAADLLEWGFAQYRRIDVVRKDDPVNVPVQVLNGTAGQVTPVAGQSLSLLRRRDEEPDLQVRYQLPAAVMAPLKRRQPIGEIIVQEHGQVIGVVPILSPTAVAATSILSAALP